MRLRNSLQDEKFSESSIIHDLMISWPGLGKRGSGAGDSRPRDWTE